MQQDERSGLLFAVTGFAMLSVGDAIIKTMAGEWSPIAVAALRFTIGAAALTALLLVKEGAGAFRPHNLKLQMWRGFCLAMATLCFFSAIFQMQLATAMALAFISPVFVSLFSGPLLGERVRPVVWLVSLIALAGVAIILRPNFAVLGWVAVLPLASAFFFALMVIANRASAGQGSALSMQAFIAIFAAPILIAAAWLGHVSGAPTLAIGTPSWDVVLRCALVAVTASTAHWLAYIGTMRAGAATIAPTTYVQILIASVLGYLLFGDMPDLLTMVGAAIIVSAGLLLWWKTPPQRRPQPRRETRAQTRKEPGD